jgi:hypothetical protein
VYLRHICKHYKEKEIREKGRIQRYKKSKGMEEKGERLLYEINNNSLSVIEKM